MNADIDDEGKFCKEYNRTSFLSYYVNDFEEYIGNIMLWSIICIFFSCCTLVCLVALIFKAKKKIIDIITPKKVISVELYSETYNILSIYLLKATIIHLSLLIINVILNIVSLAFFENYYKYFD